MQPIHSGQAFTVPRKIAFLRQHCSRCHRSVPDQIVVHSGLGTWLPAPVDGDTEFCLENNQSVDGDTGICLENDDGCSLKKQKHKTCLQKVNK